MTDALNILMLEDSPFDAELIEYLLKKEFPGARFYVASNREQLLHCLPVFVPQVVLSDNSLPDINATEALRICREAVPHIPFIMVSGTVSEEFATELIRSGGDDYILKDRLTRLPVAIKTAVEKQRREIEKQDALFLLQENEERYRTLVARVTDAFISLDRNFCYTFLNKQAGELIRKDPLSLLGRNVWEVFPDAVGSKTYHSFIQAMQEQQYLCSEDYYPPLDLWQENHIYPSPDGLSIFIRDITKQKKSQAALVELERQMMDQKLAEQRNTTKAIIRAQENERNRLGQELHDNINQLLVASKLGFACIIKEQSDELNVPIDTLDKAIEEIRKLTSRYVTPIIDVDLKELVESLLWKVKRSQGLEVSFSFEGNISDDDLKLNIYRIIQEQLNNIVKYASASRIHLYIASNQQEIVVSVSDNGVGFDTSAVRKGIGISNMINRVRTFNGQLDVQSAPGQGCTISLVIPLNS